MESPQSKNNQQQQPKSVPVPSPPKSETTQQSHHPGILNSLKKLNENILKDISIKKGRRIKYQTYKSCLIELLEKHTSNSSQPYQPKYSPQNAQLLTATIYYNLAKLGESESSLEKAIQLLEKHNPTQCQYLILRWKMQLAAMKSFSGQNNKAFEIAVVVLQKITHIFTKMIESMQTDTNPKTNDQKSLQQFLQSFLLIVNQTKKNDIIWVYNSQNNIKYIICTLRSLLIGNSLISPEQSINPFFSGFDFDISTYMALEPLPETYIQSYILMNHQQTIKQLCIFGSIACFTQATEKYYMQNYSCKYMHFKAIELGLISFEQNCTYIMFLMKVLNDHYGTKMSQIREENSELYVEYNEMKRRIPGDKKEVRMRDLKFADEEKQIEEEAIARDDGSEEV